MSLAYDSCIDIHRKHVNYCTTTNDNAALDYTTMNDYAVIGYRDMNYDPAINFSVTQLIKVPEIKDVVFNPPYTIVNWMDNTKTIVCCINEDDFNEEIGLAMAISRKYYEFTINSDYAWKNGDKKETKGARAEFKKQVKNAKRPKKK